MDFFLFVFSRLVHGVMDQEFEGVVTVLIHFNKHLEAAPAPLGARKYHLSRQFAFLLSLVAVDFKIASWDTILVEGFIGESDGFG